MAACRGVSSRTGDAAHVHADLLRRVEIDHLPPGGVVQTHGARLAGPTGQPDSGSLSPSTIGAVAWIHDLVRRWNAMSDAADERTIRQQTVESRLTRRYSLSIPVELEWLTGRHRKGLRRRVVVPVAQVLDVSIGGMLVEAPGRPDLEVDAIVELASDGHQATARVAHKHVAVDPDHQLLGIEFVEMSEGFEAALHDLVRVLRA